MVSSPSEQFAKHRIISNKFQKTDAFVCPLRRITVSDNELRDFQQRLEKAFWERPNRDVRTIKDLAITFAAWALVEIAVILRDLRKHFILTQD